MLFTLRDAQEQGVNIFQSWHEFSETNRGFCTVFFANLYAEPRYVNDRFASLVQALTLLTGATAEVSERSRAFIGHLEAGFDSQYSDDERMSPWPYHPNRRRDRDALSTCPPAS